MGFCTADIWSSFVYKSAVQKPKHTLPNLRLLTTSAHRSSAKHPPEHEEEADSDDGAEYDRVLPLLEVDLLDEAVDEGEAVGDVVELGAHGLEVGSQL